MSSEEVELDLDDKTLAGIALYAHERNITINDAVCQMLEQYIKERNGGVDQRQSQLTQNQQSVGSNPTRATKREAVLL